MHNGRFVRLLPAVIATSILLAAVARTAQAGPAVTVAPPPTQPLVAEIYDPGSLDADCSYHGVYCASDGNVYFTLSAHAIGYWARIYRFQPATGKVDLFWTTDRATPDKGRVAHGKIHSPLGEYRGELFFCTHTGHYKTRHTLPGTNTAVKPYQGGYVYAVKLKTGEGRIVAAPLHHRPVLVPMGDQRVPLDGEALISSLLDRKRGLFYALSWPSAIFVKVDVKSGQSREYGKTQDGAEAAAMYPTKAAAEQNKQNPHYQRCLRTLGLDDQGNVYGSSGYGAIWRYDWKQDRIAPMKSRMENGTASPDLDKLPPHLNMWRTITWDEKEKVFYGVHWASSWLFRFDPKKDSIEPMVQWAPAGQPIQDFAQLGLTISPRRVLYGMVHAPARKEGVQRAVHLLTLDLNTMRFQDHGPIAAASGRVVMFSESCTVAPNGDVYTVGWTEVSAERAAEVRAKRKEGGVPEVKYASVMALVRIPAARISSTASVPPARAEAGPSGPRLANPFFAMNFAWYDAKISSSNKAQAALLKELGYDGCQYLGTLEQLREVQEAMDARGLQIHTAALRDAYNISVDPGIEYNPKLKDMIRALEGRPTLVLIGFVSRQYARSSPEGDARAAAIAGELADYARQFGLRVAIYPHVNQWCERVEHALRIANKADRKNLGICFNIYHWLKTDAQRNLAPLVAASMPRLFLVTINGTSPEGSMETLDRGSYDVYGFLKPFIEAGYNGPIGLQCVGVRGDARDNLQRSMNAWRSLSARFARRS